MNKSVIEVRGLSKQYRLGATVSHDTLRDAIADRFRSIFRRKSDTPHQSDSNSTIWALKDVSFNVNEGEVLGIIGKNGAGKSTILKVLSRITEPTEGTVGIKGRVGSLLEVGTGFHPELTGRENVFLNGAILGMKKEEIKRKFDEIVAFAEIEKFLDTPVKRYSSGMYVRLAFAVAAHFEPEILVVDEVLAVGDAQFQKRCLGKMGDVAKGGRTVLFVSHNMAAVQKLCNRVVMLNQGRITKSGETQFVIDEYLASCVEQSTNVEISDIQRAKHFGERVRFVKGGLVDAEGNPTTQYKTGNNIRILLELESPNESHEDLHVNICINSIQQALITTVTSRTSYGYINCLKGKTVSIRVSLDDLVLAPGNYDITVAVGRQNQQALDLLANILPFSIIDSGIKQVVPHPNLPGFVKANSQWVVTVQ